MRLLIKLSGESLRGESAESGAFHEPTLEAIAASIAALQNDGHHIALVVGAGNIFRGQTLTEELSIQRPTADYIGMLATVQNALVLRDYFESKGIVTRVSSAISMPQICESHMPLRAMRHMEKGRVVIFAAGLGAPYFTTDSSAVQRALEMQMDMLVMAKNGVDGLYSADPEQDENAVFLKEITGSEVLERNLRAADQSAIALAKEHGLTIKVIGIDIIAQSANTDIGSLITPN